MQANVSTLNVEIIDNTNNMLFKCYNVTIQSINTANKLLTIASKPWLHAMEQAIAVTMQQLSIAIAFYCLTVHLNHFV